MQIFQRLQLHVSPCCKPIYRRYLLANGYLCLVPKVTKYHLCQERSDELSTSIQHMYSFNLFFGVLENDAWLDHVMTCSRSFVIPIFRTYISYRIDRLPNDWHFKTMFNYYI